MSILNNTKNSVLNAVSRSFGVQSLSEENQRQLEVWLQTPLGQRLLEQQCYHVDQLLRCVFGYHIMQLSISRQLDLSSGSAINHRFQVSSHTLINKGCLDGVIAQFENLPLASESVDVGILHHVLEFSLNPHQILCEASRVIIPHGYLLIIGFNPWSLLGICKPVAQFISRSSQWRYHSLPLGRIVDWLCLLDFEVVYKCHDYYGLPSDVGYRPWIDTLGRKLFPSFGAFYIVLARKQVMRMTLAKQTQQKINTLPEWGKTSAVPRKYW